LFAAFRFRNLSVGFRQIYSEVCRPVARDGQRLIKLTSQGVSEIYLGMAAAMCFGLTAANDGVFGAFLPRPFSGAFAGGSSFATPVEEIPGHAEPPMSR
jgi:hypothetical protein